MKKFFCTFVGMLLFFKSHAVGEWITVLFEEKDHTKVASLIMVEIKTTGVIREVEWRSKYPFIDLVYSKYKGSPDENNLQSCLSREIRAYINKMPTSSAAASLLESLEMAVSTFYENFANSNFYKHKK
ncbi:MAG: hypothetical protein LBQ08_02445 [Holosporaceae bacterium]|nr:hypothetical protein [Holosporaceae bacterium]